MKAGGGESRRPLRYGNTREAPRRSRPGTRIGRKSGAGDSHNVVGTCAKLMGQLFDPNAGSRLILSVLPSLRRGPARVSHTA